jgi:exodeoxyribonuclease VII large subunit
MLHLRRGIFVQRTPMENITGNSYIRLSELLSLVDDALRTTLGERTWWILAEIKERNDKGEYIYFELAEKSGTSDDLIARVRASVWRREAIAAFRNFEDITGKRPDKGLQVLLRAGVTFHAVHGFSLQLFDIDSQHMLGQLELQRRQTIAQLAAHPEISFSDGRFITPNKRAEFPTVVQHIAVITSASAAGYQDFEDSLKKNPFGYFFNVRPYFSIVQGEKAAESMRDQLLAIYKDLQDGMKTDLVVLIRGGGAQSDLLPFDQFRLAIALARFPVPVVAGIGHLKNESVADMVVHTSVKTPTQAAEFIVDHNRAFEEEIEALREMIILKSQSLLAVMNRKLDHAGTKINNGAITLVHTRTRHLERVRDHLRAAVVANISSNGNLISEKKLRLHASTEKLIYTQKHALDKLDEKLRLLDPMIILKRGYSMLLRNGEVIASSKKLNTGDKIDLVFSDGKASAEITDIKPNDHE